MARAFRGCAFPLTETIAVIAFLVALSPAVGQQKPAPPKQTQLDQRVKDLEARMNAAEQKAQNAALEKDYITRVQKQYEAYYEKAFNTQVWTLTILGIFLTAVFGLAARFGLGIFDRRIDAALRETSAQLRTEFAQQLAKEMQALRDANAAQLKALEDGLTKRIAQQELDLKLRSDFQANFGQGLVAIAEKRFSAARELFRLALMGYIAGQSRNVIPKKAAIIAAKNLFANVMNEDSAQFAANAKKELANELYNDLEEELVS